MVTGETLPAASVLCGAVASAQGTPAAAAKPACDPGASQSVAKATLFLQRAAQQVNAKQDASKDLKQAITVLTTPGKDNDAIGRAYYLGQAYILYLQQPGIAPVGPRASYGIATDPTGTIDLFAAADSAFSTVEAAQPGCRAELAQWREQKPWPDMLNPAINALVTPNPRVEDEARELERLKAAESFYAQLQAPAGDARR